MTLKIFEPEDISMKMENGYFNDRSKIGSKSFNDNHLSYFLSSKANLQDSRIRDSNLMFTFSSYRNYGVVPNAYRLLKRKFKLGDRINENHRQLVGLNDKSYEVWMDSPVEFSISRAFQSSTGPSSLFLNEWGDNLINELKDLDALTSTILKEINLKDQQIKISSSGIDEALQKRLYPFLYS